MQTLQNKSVRVVAAVILAALGAWLLVAYVQGARDSAVAQESKVKVLAASEAIPAETLAKDMGTRVREVEVIQKDVPADAVTNLGDLGDKRITHNLRPGEQLLGGHFADKPKGEAPPGLLETSVLLDAEQAVGGTIRAGDTVGVLLTMKTTGTTFAYHSVFVSNVQIQTQNSAKDEDQSPVPVAKANKYLVTLALDASGVQNVVATAASQDGTVWLTAEG